MQWGKPGLLILAVNLHKLRVGLTKTISPAH